MILEKETFQQSELKINPELDLPPGSEVKRGLHGGGNIDFAGEWALTAEFGTFGIGFSFDDDKNTLLIEDPPRWSELFDHDQRSGTTTPRIDDQVRMKFINLLAYIASNNCVDSISTYNKNSLSELVKGTPQYYWKGLVRVFEQLSPEDDGEYLVLPVEIFL